MMRGGGLGGQGPAKKNTLKKKMGGLGRPGPPGKIHFKNNAAPTRHHQHWTPTRRPRDTSWIPMLDTNWAPDTNATPTRHQHWTPTRRPRDTSWTPTENKEKKKLKNIKNRIQIIKT